MVLDGFENPHGTSLSTGSEPIRDHSRKRARVYARRRVRMTSQRDVCVRARTIRRAITVDRNRIK